MENFIFFCIDFGIAPGYTSAECKFAKSALKALEQCL